MSFAPFEIAPLTPQEQADLYPYEAPTAGYVVEVGACRPLGERDAAALHQRHAVLSVGSNRAPRQLLRKFGPERTLYVTPATLHDCDIIHSACFSYYGAVPCTAYPSMGTAVSLNAVWLTDEELEIMHATEAVGIAYDYGQWHDGQVVLDSPISPDAVFGYSTRLGALIDEGEAPFGLTAIPAVNRRFTPLSQLEARQQLYQRLPSSLQDADITQFLARLIADKPFRQEVNDCLLAQASPMRTGPFTIIKAETNQAEAYL